ncbi:hypothetical protein ANCCAN_13100 [Ancylostoma caninum]|uniref:Uncharacterized protein n=1 Tax=Ancylostoma caninum TaxID=29170 RepID=A0A368GB97_ANCCA|nr:hypothetical protein ANCCAN_13100 [Ancylostoma caninum]
MAYNGSYADPNATAAGGDAYAQADPQVSVFFLYFGNLKLGPLDAETTDVL